MKTGFSGAVRKRREKSEQNLATRVPLELKKELEAVAHVSGASVSLLMREGIKLIIAKFQEDGEITVRVRPTSTGYVLTEKARSQ